MIGDDNGVVTLDMTIWYQVIDPRASVYEVHDHVEGLRQVAVTALRNLAGALTQEQIRNGTERIAVRVRSGMDPYPQWWGIRVVRVAIEPALDPSGAEPGR